MGYDLFLGQKNKSLQIFFYKTSVEIIKIQNI